MGNVIQNLPLIDLITSDLHPHLEFQEDNLDNLTNSIKKYGIIEPLLVRPKDNKYEIILGNRRYNAAKQLGLETVPAIIINVNDEIALNMIISDNIQRKELSSKEEAKLYEKALSFPNINTEQLSINLGIPKDRINSKLELIKKNNSNIKDYDNLNQSEYQNNNNSVNNDIINLTELNKEEQERDDYIMNNNQFVDNNMNNNVNGGAMGTDNQAPAFGGRFFPSLEDQPTNMNMGTGPNVNQNGFTNNLNGGPLIDLTDTSTDSINSNVPEQNVNTNSIDQLVSTPTPEVPSSLPPISNTPQMESPIPPIENSTPNDMPVGLNIPNVEQSPVISGMETPLPNNNIPNPQPDISIPNIPELNNGSNIANIDEVTSTTPEVQGSLPPISNMQQPDISIPPIENPVANEMPAEMNIPGIEQTSSIINEPNNMDNIPNLGQIEEQISTPITDNANPLEQPTLNNQGKDILPVINMIKNLAISIESLGYKLNITENDSNESYQINIEVEK